MSPPASDQAARVKDHDQRLVGVDLLLHLLEPQRLSGWQGKEFGKCGGDRAVDDAIGASIAVMRE